MITATQTDIAACAVRIRKAGDTIQLFPAGSFRARDGRPAKIPAWIINEVAATRVIAQVESRLTPLVIDYEHQTLTADTSGHPAPAAGWFSKLEWREGKGLYAVGVKWTERAKSMIDADEYRYLSPVFKYNPTTGEVLELLMAAVTNNPAIDGIADLAAASYLFNLTTTHHKEVSVDEETLKLLGLAKDSSNEKIQEAIKALHVKANKVDTLEVALSAATAKTSADEAEKQVPVETMRQLQAQIAALTSQVTGAEVDRLVGQGLTDGRLLPVMQDWARNLGKTDVASLRSFLDTAAPIAALSGMQTGGMQPSENGKTQLTDIELAVCKQLGVTETDYLKAKEGN